MIEREGEGTKSPKLRVETRSEPKRERASEREEESKEV